MKKVGYIFLLFLIAKGTFCQNQIIDDKDIPKLDSIIEQLEKEYDKSNSQVFYSFPQTTGSYFEIITSKPEKFISELKKSETIEQLQNKFSGLQVDKDLLVVKNTYSNYKGEKKVSIKSFQIDNNSGHSINVGKNKIRRIKSKQDKIKIYYSSYQHKWGKNKGATTVMGFYLNENFRINKIPKKYSDWVNYTDIITKPKTSIFNNKSNKYKPSKKSIIDSLIIYYELKTNKPTGRNGQDFVSFHDELFKWKSKKEKFTDSLYQIDEHFKTLLNEALIYAEKHKISDDDLEDFTAQLISKERALKLMRQNKKVGTCSYDEQPIIQLKRIANLAAKTQNWEVFIKAFLDVMNDNVARNASSNIASNARKTYIEELVKLNLNIDKILLGSNLRIQDTIRKHYFSSGDKIAKAYANLNSQRQAYFENSIYEIINSKEVDAFNKLHFYNTLLNYKYFLKDSIKQTEIKKKLEKIVVLFPYELKSRIENPNKQLRDLLSRERNELDKFIIKSSVIGNISSHSYSGYCWIAELIDKNFYKKIIYELTMPIGEKITPLQNFIDKKGEIDSSIIKHPFLQKIINLYAENEIYIQFTKDKSFTDYKSRVTQNMPNELKLDFEEAISLCISFPKRNNAYFILLKNGNLLLMDMPENFELPGYKFKELLTEEEESFLSTTYSSYKLFDKKGKMLN